MSQQASTPVDRREGAVRWVATYALGTAWAGLDRREAIDEILFFAAGDRAVIEGARHVIREVPLSQQAIRRRAETLLSDALEGAS